MILAHQFFGELVLDGPGGFANLELTPSAMIKTAFLTLPRAEEE
jgi:hypothetical protein